jgi:hypothetical protein
MRLLFNELYLNRIDKYFNTSESEPESMYSAAYDSQMYDIWDDSPLGFGMLAEFDDNFGVGERAWRMWDSGRDRVGVH